MRYLYYLIILLVLLTNCSQNDRIRSKKEIRKITRAYNKSICKTPYADSVAYSEMALHNGKYVKFNQASGYILSMGYDCQIPIDNFCFLFTNFAKSQPKPEWLDYLKYLYANGEVKYQTDIAPGYNSAINCFRRFEMFGPVNKKNIDDFLFSDLGIENDSIKKVKFISKNPQRDFSGTIFYNHKSSIILKVELDSCEFYSDAFDQFKKATVTLNYANHDKLFLSSILVDFSQESLRQVISLKIFGNILKPFILNNNEWDKLTTNDRRPIIEYYPCDMAKLNYSEIKAIREDLETDDKKLEEQFLENHGKEYYNSVLTSGLKPNEIGADEYLPLKHKIITKCKTK